MVPLLKKALFVVLSGFILIILLTSVFSPKEQVLRADYDQLLDVPFRFLHLPECSKDQKVLILVHTSPGNIERRNVLRETWANKNATDLQVLFLTGIPKSPELQHELETEILYHKNFLQGNFYDSYVNLTYKHVMGLKYAFYHCPHIEYVLKIDDDVFVNTRVLKKFLEMYTEKFGRSRNILCSLRSGHPVLRDGKWAVSKEDFPEKIYPNHCLGFAIIYPKKTLELLYLAAQKSKYFWIDDVHVTGSIARTAKVRHVNVDSLITSFPELEQIMDPKFDIDLRPFVFGPAETQDYHLVRLHEYTSQHGQKASIMEYLN